jgi:hypothetical protein
MRWHYAVLTTAVVLFATNSQAQHGHDEGHYDYSNWASKKTGNCCNDKDCGFLSADEWRETARGDEVKILGQWCPVKAEHYIIKGKSPDWTKAHACVAKGADHMYSNPCDRLLCFAGMPNF